MPSEARESMFSMPVVPIDALGVLKAGPLASLSGNPTNLPLLGDT
jgi:hypothetical protein